MADEQTRPTPPLPPDAMIIVPVRGMVLFPGMVAAGHRRPPALDRGGPAGRARAAPDRRSDAAGRRDAGACGDRPASGRHGGQYRCATSRRPDGDPSPDLPGPASASGSSSSSMAGRSSSRASCGSRSRSRARPRSRRASCTCAGQALEALQLLPQAPQELAAAISGIGSPAALADLAAGYDGHRPEEKQELLETIDVGARIDKVSRLLAHRIEVLRLSHEIGRQTKAALDERQREVLLREQMAAIQRQLGEGDAGKAQEIAELAKRSPRRRCRPRSRSRRAKELRRLERMPEAAGEYGMVRTYLDWLIELPWALARGQRRSTSPRRGASSTRTITVSTRSSGASSSIWRCASLRPDGKAPILCFVGPPGVGKTSLGQSIARAMGRKFVRVSASAACTTKPRSAAIAAPISGRCPATSSRRSARPAPATA